MRIICPNCRSEYEFDGSRVSSRGTKVKCSSCEHVFTVYEVAEDGTPVEGAPLLKEKTRRRIGKLGGERLILRQEGRTYPIQNLSLLQRWIVEKRVLATDEISIDGKTWELVSRLSELRPFFGVLRQLRETRRELSHTRERLQETLELRSVEPAEVPRARTTDDVVANWESEEPVRLPAATSAPHPESLDGEEDDDLPPAHTEESVDRHMAAELGYPAAFDDPDVAPDDVAEPESAELVAHRTDMLVPPEEPARGPVDTVEAVEAIPFPEPDEPRDDPYPADEPTLPSLDTPSEHVEAGLFVGTTETDEPEADDGAAESVPIPRAARETVSRMAAEEVEEPYYDPAVQSVVTPVIPSIDDESTVESPPPAGFPPIDFDSAIGTPDDEESADAAEPPQRPQDVEDEKEEEQERLSGEESRPLDEPSDDTSDREERIADSVEPPPPIDFDSAMGRLSDDREDEPLEAAPADDPPAADPPDEEEPAQAARAEEEPAEDRPEPPPPIDFDSAMGSLSDDGEEESQESGESLVRAEPPPPIDFDSAMGALSGDDEEEPQDEPEEEEAAAKAPPPIDFDSAMGPLSDDEEEDEEAEEDEEDEEDGLGKDFDTFESSYEESFPVDSQDEEWEGDDFSQQFDSMEDDEERPNMLPYIIGAAVLLVVLVGGAWYAIHSMKAKTRTLESFGDGDATAEVAEATTPEEVATEGEEDATEGEEDATEGDEEDAAADEAEEPTDAEAEAPTDAEIEEPTDASDRPEEIEEPEWGQETEETPPPAPPTPAPPTHPSDRPAPPGMDPFDNEPDWDDEPDWGDDAGTPEPPPLPADAAAHAAELASSGQHGEAIQEYLRAFLTDPNNARTRKECGWSYIEIGNNGEAAKQFRKAVLLNSMDSESHYGLGLAYEGMGRNDDAINEYETYLGLAPNGREAMEVQILLKRLQDMRGGS